MGRFTKSRAGGIDLDGFVKGNLDRVVSVIRDEIKDLRAVILMGGYGRGEGAVDVVKGKPMLMNDFDMYVITEKQYGDDFLEDLGVRCSRMIGKGGLAHPEGFEERYEFNRFFHVDIRCIPENRMHSMPPMQRYYEMRHAGAVLYGPESILRKFPDIKPHEIPRPEALRIIMNRMMLLLMSFNPRFIRDRKYMSTRARCGLPE